MTSVRNSNSKTGDITSNNYETKTISANGTEKLLGSLDYVAILAVGVDGDAVAVAMAVSCQLKSVVSGEYQN
ncbi:unnamed protein product [Ceratitis capitata]|uniref:(Mediterranean fruit fly) hypothetical protein n=1 Tax=Ceratitis capitata TaxID=7213 RepID=A0A811U2S2_CERCA|nr:unnamed protein product [Ceratitis capitata]